MKRLLIITITILSFATVTNAQELGIRFNQSYKGGGASVDGVFGIGSFSRIHADLNFMKKGIGLDALYDFMHKPLTADAPGLNWYTGVGPSLTFGEGWFMLGASGEIGLEYDFRKQLSVPITVSCDWRPTFWIVEKTEMTWGGFGINVRYCF